MGTGVARWENVETHASGRHQIREIMANFEDTWHPAPRRQYVVSLGGGVDITVSDGETRHIAAGEILLVEDTTGKGHITKSSGSTPRYTLFLPID
jgi:hypothetical protein